MKYLCTFGSGWDKAIKKIFEKKFANYYVESLGDGIIVFSTKDVIDIKKLFFFNNVYLLQKE